MRKTTLAIALLIATNIGTGAYLVQKLQSPPAQIYADHLEDMRLKMPEGNLQARVGDSRSGKSATLVFTPHGAIQFHQELGRMFALIMKKAAGQAAPPKDPPAASGSDRPSL